MSESKRPSAKVSPTAEPREDYHKPYLPDETVDPPPVEYIGPPVTLSEPSIEPRIIKAASELAWLVDKWAQETIKTKNSGIRPTYRIGDLKVRVS